MKTFYELLFGFFSDAGSLFRQARKYVVGIKNAGNDGSAFCEGSLIAALREIFQGSGNFAVYDLSQ